MGKTDDALKILVALGMPRGQQNERSALVLLALAGVRPNGSWKKAGQAMLRIWDIMGFIRIAESPDHMIHFNGPKVLGSYSSAGALEMD